MIIKEDKLAQAEADAEQLAETPPPYSLAPEVRVAVVGPEVPSPARTQTQTQTQSPHRDLSRTATPSTPSLAPSSTAVEASSSGPISSNGSKPSDPYASTPPPPDVPRTGFLHLQRANKFISERIVIDPYLPHPPHSSTSANAGSVDEEEDLEESEDFGPRFGSPVPGDPERKNLRLECKNGNVGAEVWVVGGPGENADNNFDEEFGRKKAGIDIRAKNGFVRVKMHASPSSPSFALRIATKNGGVRVALPRTFVGPLTTRTRNGWVTLSPALSGCVTAFSEVRGTRKSFIGDFVESGYGRGEWLGSSLDITCENGRIKLCYLDEDTGKANSGLLGRLFN